MSLIAVAIAAFVGLATIEGQSEDPEALIRQGNQLRQQGDDLRAEGYFRRAYQIAKTGRTAAQLGLVELALESYGLSERYLSEALESDDAWVKSHGEVLERSRTLARSHMVRVEVSGLPRGAVAMSASASMHIDPSGVIWIEAGHSKVQFTAPGYRSTIVEFDGRVGATLHADLLLVAQHVSTPVENARADVPGEASSSPPRRWISGVAGGLGLGAGIAGTALYVVGMSRKREIESDAKAGHTFNTSDANWEGLRNAGIALWAVGGSCLVASAILFRALSSHEGSGLALSSTGTSLQVLGSF